MTRLMLTLLLWLVPGSALATSVVRGSLWGGGTLTDQKLSQALSVIQEWLQEHDGAFVLHLIFVRFDSSLALAHGISTGEAQWLDLYLPLYSGANGVQAETLSTAISYALKRNPTRVIEIMDAVSAMNEEAIAAFAREYGWEPFNMDRYASLTCGLTWLELPETERPPVVPDTLRELDTRIAALRKVNKPELRGERDACLAGIEVSKAKWDERLNPPEDPYKDLHWPLRHD